MGTNKAKRRYITGFDGLRALAVIGVITFHLWPTAITGGWLGVPLFFVLSGYLITDLLIQEFDNNGRIDLLGFYRRRLKRLYPALVVMLFATATIIGLFARDLLYNLRAILTTNLTYVYNLWATVHGDSYFDSWGGSSPFTHLWSLSIEGQFYFIWPIVVWLVLRFKPNRFKVGAWLLGLSAVSAVLMGVMYDPNNINRTYYGTDTRLFAILVGTALAFVWPSVRLSMTRNPNVRKALNYTGLGALAVTLVAFLFLNGQAAPTYYGVMYIMTLIIAILIAVTAHPMSFLSKALDNKPLNYLGTRSYSIYLYQLPVFVFFDKFVKVNDTLPMNLLKIAIVLALSELSYRFIENIFRRFKKIDLGGLRIDRLKQNRRLQIALAVAAIFVLGTTNAVMAKQAGEAKPKSALEKRLDTNKNKIDDANRKALEAAKKANEASSSSETSSSEASSSSEAASSSSEASTDPAADNEIAAKYGLTDGQYNAVKNKAVTAIGDSVMLDVAPDLQELMPNTVADGKVGRQASEVPGIVQYYANKGALAQNVVFSIGTNGAITSDQIDQIMGIIGSSRQVYWVNNFANRVWVAGNDYELGQAAQRYPNFHIVDWKNNVRGPNESVWLGSDDVHPNKTGSAAYAGLIAKAMAN